MGDRKADTLDYEPVKTRSEPSNLVVAFNTLFLMSAVVQIVVVHPMLFLLIFDRGFNADVVLYLLFVYGVWFGLVSLLRISSREVLGIRMGGLVGLGLSLCPLIYIYGARPAN